MLAGMRTLSIWVLAGLLVSGTVVTDATGPPGSGPAVQRPAVTGFAAPVGPDAPVSGTPVSEATAAWSVPEPADKPGRGIVPRGEFGWPLAEPVTVLRRFEAPPHQYGRGHRGVDLGGHDEQSVLAAGAGVVVFAGMVAGRPVVSIDHPNGLRTTYEPVAVAVTAGQLVARGDPIGTLRAGHPGCHVAACLHWGLRRGEQYLDPLRLLSTGPVRLLPGRGG